MVLNRLSRPTVSQNSTLIITDSMLVSITNKGVGVPFWSPTRMIDTTYILALVGFVDAILNLIARWHEPKCINYLGIDYSSWVRYITMGVTTLWVLLIKWPKSLPFSHRSISSHRWIGCWSISNRVTLNIQFAGTHSYTWVEIDTERVNDQN